VLGGEAGIGKSALLEHVATQAQRCRVLFGAGVEADTELAFAALHQVLSPLLGRVDRLLPPQRDAVNVALGLLAAPPPDRFLVALAVLNLLSDAASEQPVVCLIDDEQWLDRASAHALALAARRLDAAFGQPCTSRGRFRPPPPPVADAGRPAWPPGASAEDDRQRSECANRPGAPATWRMRRRPP
jgi:AAA ATPase domain